MQSNQWLPAVMIIVLTVAGVYMLLPSLKPAVDTTEIAQQVIEQKRDSALVEAYRGLYLSALDSITMLEVQKGQVEIELNRKTEQLNQANNRYKESRVIKDTGKALLICDSIVYTYLPDYWKSAEQLPRYYDTLRTWTHGWLVKYNDTGNAIALRLDTVRAELIETKKDKAELIASNKELKEAKKHQRKKIISAGAIGAAVGVLVAFLANVF